MAEDRILSNFANLGEIDPRLPEIGTNWLYGMPFFYTYFANTTFEKSDLKDMYCGIMPHNNAFKIIIGPMLRACPDIKKVEGVLIHEYLHIIMETFSRIGERKMRPWNVATDYAINEEVLKHSYTGKKLELPDQCLLFEDLKKLGYEGKCIAEDIYDFIMEKSKEQQEQQDQDGQEGQGQGKGDSKDGTGSSKGQDQSTGPDGKKNFDDHSGLDQLKDAINNNPITNAKMKKLFETAKANQEIQKGIGSDDGSMWEFIEKISRPQVYWRGLLHASVNAFVKGQGHKVYNWSKKNRKNLPFPGKKRFNKKVVLAVDTSGSIDTKLAGKFFSEIDRISQDNEVTLLQFDTEVQKVEKYRSGNWRKIQFTGRGGTSCKEMFNHIATDRTLKNTVLVVFSDGGFYADYDTHDLDVIWCIAGPTDACKDGKIVVIKD